MAFPKCRLTESKRLIIALGLFFSNLFCILTSYMVIGNGVYFKFVIESKISFTEHYIKDILPWFMIVVGILNLLGNIFGAFICIVTYNVAQRQNSRKLRFVQLPYVYFSLFVFICLFVMAVVSSVQTLTIRTSFGDSLLIAMKHYKTDVVIKKDIDRLQMDFQCCGAENYHDWFQTSWLSSDLINLNSTRVKKHLIEGEYYNDDVPFSCCDAEETRPCIHHFVLDDSKHYGYNHQEKTTLYERGCQDVLIDYFGKILEESCIIIVVTFFLALVNIVGMRFLQTSVYEAIDSGLPESDASGWLFNSIKRKPVNGRNNNENAKKEPLLPTDNSNINNISDASSDTIFEFYNEK